MKTTLVISSIFCFVMLLAKCTSIEVNNNKDLDENMLDMMMYHDNLGLYLRKADADYSTWLLEGMDSTLQVIAKKFDEHRKLNDPFGKSYNNLLAPSIKIFEAPFSKTISPRLSLLTVSSLKIAINVIWIMK